jgi:hypothetical protein
VRSCDETVGVLDGNSNLHRNCIESDMNVSNLSIQECDCRSNRSKEPTVRNVDFLNGCETKCASN